MDIKIIGVVGQIAAGKGILVNYLTKNLGFSSFSLSSIVHRELKKRGVKKYTRQMLQEVGNELRRGYGDEVLVSRTLKVIKDQKGDKKIVVEGIRNPGEIEFLKKDPNFILIGVKAMRTLRFKRLISRNKDWDPKNYKDFLEVDSRDIGVGQGKSGQQVGKSLAYCDYVLTNNKDIKDFEEKIKKLMSNNQ
jgi:dephospho-CoA kinase